MPGVPSHRPGPIGGCPPFSLVPLPGVSGLIWQSDIPLTALEPLGDVQLKA